MPLVCLQSSSSLIWLVVVRDPQRWAAGFVNSMGPLSGMLETSGLKCLPVVLRWQKRNLVMR